MKDMRISWKIGTLSLIMGLLILVVGGVGFLNLNRVNSSLESMYNDRLVAIRDINENRTHARAVEADIFNIILNSDNPEKQREKKN